MTMLNKQLKPLALLGILSIISPKEVYSSLRPYYIHFPPPVIPVPNALAPVDFPPHPWPLNNSTFSRSFPNGPIPLIVHTWVKPDTSERIKLENGTVIYYVSPPWGGIRASSPSATPPHTTTAKIMSSSVYSNDFSTLSPGENEIERQSLFEDPNRRSGGYATSAGGIQTSSIDITTPPSPNREGTAWGQGHLGFGWPTSTQMNNKLPETTTATSTTSSNPTRQNQIGNNATKMSNDQTTTTLKTTTEKATTTTTADPVAASTNARFPVSDSVRKFRRIVAQIRAITKKELGAQKKTASTKS